MERHEGVPEEWDAAVGALSGATHSHLAGWHSVFKETMGHETVALKALDAAGRWIGVLPLVHVRTAVFGSCLISMPFLNAGGPIGSEDARRALALSASQEAKDRRCKLLELRNRYRRSDDLPPSDRKITVTLALPTDPLELMKSFHPKLRTNIRKPLKQGMELRFGPDQVAPFWQVFAQNMRDLGTPVASIEFFHMIARTFPDSAIFAALYHEGRPVGAQCSFVFGDTLEMLWGSTLREVNSLKPSSYIHWAFMELAIERGLSSFDFGRCSPDSGTHKFKQQWGGQDVPLPWSSWSANGSASRPSADRRIFRMASSAWQWLPLPVANRLGPPIARYLP